MTSRDIIQEDESESSQRSNKLLAAEKFDHLRGGFVETDDMLR